MLDENVSSRTIIAQTVWRTIAAVTLTSFQSLIRTYTLPSYSADPKHMAIPTRQCAVMKVPAVYRPTLGHLPGNGVKWESYTLLGLHGASLHTKGSAYFNHKRGVLVSQLLSEAQLLHSWDERSNGLSRTERASLSAHCERQQCHPPRHKAGWLHRKATTSPLDCVRKRSIAERPSWLLWIFWDIFLNSF